MQWVVGTSLIRDHIWFDTAFNQFRQHIGGVTTQADRDSLTFGGIALNTRQGVIKVVSLFIQVAGTQAEVEARLPTLNIQ